MIVDGYGIVYNSVLWGNATLEHTRQFYGKNGKTAESNVPASIQVYNTALQNLSNTIWGVNTVTQKRMPCPIKIQKDVLLSLMISGSLILPM